MKTSVCGIPCADNRVCDLGNGLRRITAPNASSMTMNGTNTYLAGWRDVAVIDPGPDDDGHLQLILEAAAAGGSITRIFVTHSHRDHTALVPRLSQATGAEILAWSGPSGARSSAMEQLSAVVELGGGGGLDHEFEPTRTLADGERIAGSEWTFEAIWTPGHLGNHLCFAWLERDCLFTGDHLMGWSTTIISPPGGDMGEFMRSLEKLMHRTESVYYPGHGEPVLDPQVELRAQYAHRKSREKSIVRCLESGLSDCRQITAEIYQDLPAQLLAAAERNVLAHLLDLLSRNRVEMSGNPIASDCCFGLLDCAGN